MNRFYVPRKESSRGLSNIQECVHMEEQSLSRYLDTREEELLRATKEENLLTDWNSNTDIQHKHRIKQERKDKWMSEQLHGE